eukprot:3926470-Pleurochrysis_carterae.AAC.1
MHLHGEDASEHMRVPTYSRSLTHARERKGVQSARSYTHAQTLELLSSALAQTTQTEDLARVRMHGNDHKSRARALSAHACTLARAFARACARRQKRRHARRHARPVSRIRARTFYMGAHLSTHAQTHAHT